MSGIRSNTSTGYRSLLLAVLSGASFGVGWLYPSTVVCAVLGWAASLSLAALLLTSEKPYRFAYLSGLIANGIGFYWLVGTIRDFGGYPTVFALAIFGLFMVGSAVQYLIAVFAYKRLPPWIGTLGLSSAVAWVLSELVSVRIFPWHVGHMQIAFRPLAQAADLGGSMLLSLLVLWCSEALVRAIRAPSKALLLAPIVLAAAIGYGTFRLQQPESGAEQKIAIVQANISTQEKHNVRLFVKNTERYVALTKTAAEHSKDGTLLVIWPESVILDWVYDRIGQAMNNKILPYFGDSMALLVGALTFSDREHYYNSAVAIYPDGTVPVPYHKQILMPFGEYIPLAETLPWLKQFNPMAADGFTDFPMKRTDGTASVLKVSPLICYEDILQSLGRKAAARGAEVLVNMTNDAWFGRSVEPRQHHLIASFRAIENRRYLIRSTNTGFTAVVSPTGVTTAQLPVFSENILYTSVQPRSEITVYTRLGNAPYWLLLAFWVTAWGVGRLRRKNAG